MKLSLHYKLIFEPSKLNHLVVARQRLNKKDLFNLYDVIHEYDIVICLINHLNAVTPLYIFTHV